MRSIMKQNQILAMFYHLGAKQHLWNWFVGVVFFFLIAFSLQRL